MSRKKLTPSPLRRCAVFLALFGASALSVSRVGAGIYVAEPSNQGTDTQGMHAVSMESPKAENILKLNLGSPGSVSHRSSVALDPFGPGLTGENWFAALENNVGQPGASDVQASTTTAKAPAVAPGSPAPGTATAIPSLPSFWSGLSCCAAIAFLGMFPRVRRAIR